MALSTIGTNSIADDAVGNTKLDLTANYAFTGTITGAGAYNLLQTQTADNSSTITFTSTPRTTDFGKTAITIIANTIIGNDNIKSINR